MTFPDTARAYEEDPAPRTFRSLRADIQSDASYRPDADAEAATQAARDAGDHAEVVAVVTAMMPGAHLSPGAHGLLAAAYDALGDHAAAARQRALTKLALRSILDTGDGSEQNPWHVLRVSDEYDVLRVLGRPSTGQELVERQGRQLDRHRHADGSESWFDVTGLRTRPTASGS